MAVENFTYFSFAFLRQVHLLENWAASVAVSRLSPQCLPVYRPCVGESTLCWLCPVLRLRLRHNLASDRSARAPVCFGWCCRRKAWVASFSGSVCTCQRSPVCLTSEPTWSRVVCTLGHLRLLCVSSEAFEPSSNTFWTWLQKNSSQAAVLRFLFFPRHQTRWRRQKKICPSQASQEVLLRTCLQLAQTYPSTCRQAQSVVWVTFSRLSLSISVARYFSPTVSVFPYAEWR